MDSLAVVIAALVVLITTAPLFRGTGSAPSAERPAWRVESAQILKSVPTAPLRRNQVPSAGEQADEPHLPHYEVNASSPIAGVIEHVVSSTTDVSFAGAARVFQVPVDNAAFLPAATFIVRVQGVTPTV